MRLSNDMQAALQLLFDRGERALVRTHSQWWMPEIDTLAGPLVGPEHRDTRGRLVYSGQENREPVLLIRTPTVSALVSRGLLRFTGRKRRVLSGTSAMAYARAEMTPLALHLHADRVENAARSAQDMMRKLTARSK